MDTNDRGMAVAVAREVKADVDRLLQAGYATEGERLAVLANCITSLADCVLALLKPSVHSEAVSNLLQETAPAIGLGKVESEG